MCAMTASNEIWFEFVVMIIDAKREDGFHSACLQICLLTPLAACFSRHKMAGWSV
jgi:hypothetical protein